MPSSFPDYIPAIGAAAAMITASACTLEATSADTSKHDTGSGYPVSLLIKQTNNALEEIENRYTEDGDNYVNDKLRIHTLPRHYSKPNDHESEFFLNPEEAENFVNSTLLAGLTVLDSYVEDQKDDCNDEVELPPRVALLLTVSWDSEENQETSEENQDPPVYYDVGVVVTEQELNDGKQVDRLVFTFDCGEAVGLPAGTGRPEVRHVRVIVGGIDHNDTSSGFITAFPSIQFFKLSGRDGEKSEYDESLRLD